MWSKIIRYSPSMLDASIHMKSRALIVGTRKDRVMHNSSNTWLSMLNMGKLCVTRSDCKAAHMETHT